MVANYYDLFIAVNDALSRTDQHLSVYTEGRNYFIGVAAGTVHRFRVDTSPMRGVEYGAFDLTNIRDGLVAIGKATALFGIEAGKVVLNRVVTYDVTIKATERKLKVAVDRNKHPSAVVALGSTLKERLHGVDIEVDPKSRAPYNGDAKLYNGMVVVSSTPASGFDRCKSWNIDGACRSGCRNAKVVPGGACPFDEDNSGSGPFQSECHNYRK